MALDIEIWAKVESNRFILGMAAFCIGILFNSLSFLMTLGSGLVRQSTGIYLLCLTLADTAALIFGVLMEEFYAPLIDVFVFADSDDPVALCQAVYFLRELFYYWRWFLLATLIIDRCLFTSGVAGMRRLVPFAGVFALAWLLVSAGLAGYWIHFVDEILIPGAYQPGMCRVTNAPPGDHESSWFYMDSIVHLLIPDLVMVVAVLVVSLVLLCLLHRKSAQAQEPDDFNLTKALIGLGVANFLVMISYSIINGVILYVNKAYPDTYDLSEEVDTKLKYSSRILEKIGRFALCITFLLLLFSRQFRSFCCK